MEMVKYDMSIVMPICDATKAFFRRYEDMKKYGFLNIGDRKLELRLLIGPDEDFYGKKIDEGWPEGIDVVVVKTPYNDVARKIVYFYATLTEEQINLARWHIKIDDDSVNDISRMIQLLDEDYDWTRPEYIVTEIRYEIEENEYRALKDMGLEHLCASKRIAHEWEASVCSLSAMMAIRNNEKSKEYLKRRLKLPGGFGDQCVGICLYFSKVQPHAAGFMSYWNVLPYFTLFGGHVAHVHLQLERNMETRPFALFKALIERKSNKISDLVADKKWVLKREDGHVSHHFFSKDYKLLIDQGGLQQGLWCPTGEDGLLIVYDGSPWRGLDFLPSGENAFSTICPDTGFLITMNLA